MPAKRRKTRKARHLKRAKKFRPKPKQKRVRATIEFCEKCGSILVPAKKGKTTLLKCRGCGAEKRKDIRALKIVEEPNHTKGVTVLEKDTTPLPITEMKCEQCGNPNAYFWLQQTRSADEPPTQFFRCTKCKHTWREYK